MTVHLKVNNSYVDLLYKVKFELNFYWVEEIVFRSFLFQVSVCVFIQEVKDRSLLLDPALVRSERYNKYVGLVFVD